MNRVVLATGIPFSDWVEFSWSNINTNKLPIEIIEDPGFNGFIALVRPNISQFERGINNRFYDSNASDKCIEISIISRELIDSRALTNSGRRKKLEYNSYFDFRVIDKSDFKIDRSSFPLYFKTLKDYCELTYKYYDKSSSAVLLDYGDDRGRGVLQDRKRIINRSNQYSILATLFWIYEKVGY